MKNEFYNLVETQRLLWGKKKFFPKVTCFINKSTLFEGDFKINSLNFEFPSTVGKECCKVFWNFLIIPGQALSCRRGFFSSNETMFLGEFFIDSFWWVWKKWNCFYHYFSNDDYDKSSRVQWSLIRLELHRVQIIFEAKFFKSRSYKITNGNIMNFHISINNWKILKNCYWVFYIGNDSNKIITITSVLISFVSRNREILGWNSFERFVSLVFQSFR